MDRGNAGDRLGQHLPDSRHSATGLKAGDKIWVTADIGNAIKITWDPADLDNVVGLTLDGAKGTYPTLFPYGEDVTFSFKTKDGYVSQSVTAKKTVTVNGEDKTQDVTVTAKQDTTDKTKYTYTIKWDDVKDAKAETNITITAKGVQATRKITYKDTTKAKVTAASLTAAQKVNTVENTGDYTFTLTAQDGYTFAIANNATATAQQAVGFYAIKAGATLTSTTPSTDVKAITVTIDGNVLTGKIENVTEDIDIHLGALTKEATYTVTDSSSSAAKELYDTTLVTGDNKATYNTNLTFTVKAKADKQVVFSDVKYAIAEEAPAANSDKWISLGTSGSYTIAGSKITNNVFVLVDMTARETVAVTIAKDTSVDGAIDANGIAYDAGGATSTKYVAEAEISILTGSTLNLTVTTDGTAILDKALTNTETNGSVEVYRITGWTKNGNVYTINGIVMGAGAITLKGSALQDLTVNIAKNDDAAGITKLGYTTDDGGTWTTLTSGTKVKAPKTADTVKLGYQKSSTSYKVTAANKDGDAVAFGETADKDGWYVTESAIDLSSAAAEITLTAAMDADTIYVYNTAPDQLTRWTLKTDSGALNPTFVSDYNTNARSTKVGVVKTNDTTFRVLDAVPTRAAATSALTFTYTVASGYDAAVLAIGETEYQTRAAAIQAGIGFDDTKKTITIPKTAVAAGATIFLGVIPKQGGVIFIDPAVGNTTPFTAIMSVNGIAVGPDDETHPTAEKFAADTGYKATLGEKVTVTVTADDGYTITEASLIDTSKAATASGYKKAISLAAQATSFTTTVTGTAYDQGIQVTVTPKLTVGELYTGVNEETEKKITFAGGTKKVAVDSDKHTVTTYTYNAIEADTKYFVDFVVGDDEDHEAYVIKKITATGGTKAATAGTYDETAEAWAINVDPDDAGKTITFAVSYGGADDSDPVIGTVTAAYTVKANKTLTSAAISGTKTDRTTGITSLTQDVGTKKTYNITGINSGASLASLLVAAPDGVDATIDVTKKTLTLDITKAIKDPLDVAEGETPGDPNLILYIESGDTDGYDTEDETLQEIYFSTTNSVAGKIPAVTLTKATDVDLTMELSLPTTLSATLKSLADGAGFVYAVDVAGPNDEAVAGTAGEDGYKHKVTYWLADPTTGKATATVPVWTSATTGQVENGANFLVTATVYLVPTTASFDAEAFNPAGDGAVLATSATSAAKTFTVSPSKYPTSLTLKATANATLYAGQVYEADYVDAEDNEYVTLATVATDSAATVVNGEYDVVSESSNPASITTIENGEIAGVGTFWFDAREEKTENVDEIPYTETGLGVIVKDGRVLLPLESIDAWKIVILDSGSASYTLTVTAPHADGGQLVTASMKVNVAQRAVVGRDDEDALTGSMNVWAQPNGGQVMLQKKENAAASEQLSINYNTYSTTANLNKWTWSIDWENTQIAATSAEEAKKLIDLTQTGKLTVKKDLVFDNGPAMIFVKAESAYNTDNYLLWRVMVAPASWVPAQGELVLATTVGDGVDVPNRSENDYMVLYKKGNAAMTFAELEAKAAAIGGASAKIELVLLKKNAVIETDGYVDADKYFAAPSEFGVLTNYKSSNTKIAYLSYDNTVQDYVVSLAKSAVGTVTFSATAPWTNAAKSLAVTFKAATLTNTATEKDYFTLALANQTTPFAAAATVATPDAVANYADAKKTLTFDSKTYDDESLVWVRVLKGTVSINNRVATQKTAPAALTDYYTQAALTAGTGVTIVSNQPVIDGNVAYGLYQLRMTGNDGTVRVNGKTYTLHDEAKEGRSKAGAISQRGSAYGDYALRQTVTFAAANNIPGAAAVGKLIPDNDTTALANASAQLLAVNPTVAYTTVNNKPGFTLTFTGILPKGKYTAYAVFKDGTGKIVSDPQKITLTLSQAPAFAAKTSYTIDLQASAAAKFSLTDSRGGVVDAMGNKIQLLSITNVNTKGEYNGFTKAFGTNAEAAFTGNDLALAATDELLKLPASDLTGYVTYTSDGGVTEKTVKVTLAFKAITDSDNTTKGAVWAADLLKDAINTEAAAWHSDYTTQAASLKHIQSLLNLPSNIKVAWDTSATGKFTYDGATTVKGKAAELDAAPKATGTLKITNTLDRNDVATIVIGGSDIAGGLVSPLTAVTFTTSEVKSFDYTIKDGAGNTTKTITADASDDSEVIQVPYGATLTITKTTAKDGMTPDLFLYATDTDEKEVVKEVKSGAVAFPKVTTALSKAAIIAENTINVTKTATVASAELGYTDAYGDTKSFKLDTANTGKVNVKTGVALTSFKATATDTNDVTATEKDGTTTATLEEADTQVPGAVVTFQAGDTSGAKLGTAVTKTRTYAVKTTPHKYAVAVDVSGADVLTADGMKYYDTATRQWENVKDGSINVPYGQTVQIQVTKKRSAGTIGAKEGEHTLKAVQGTGALTPLTIRNTATADTVTFTTNVKTTESATKNKVTISSSQNYIVQITNNGTKNNAISALKINGKAVSSGAKVVVPAGEPYTVSYTIKKGYADELTADADSQDATTKDTVKTLSVASLTKDGIFTVAAKKTTLIGAYDPDSNVKDEVASVIDYMTVTYDIQSGFIVDSDNTITDGNGAAIENEVGTTVILHATTKAGYDLKISTEKATGNPVLTSATAKGPLTVVAKEDGTKVYTYTATIVDGLVAINLHPVASDRTITVTNGLGSSVSAIGYQLEGKTTYTTATSGKAFTATYKQPVKIRFTVANGNVPDGFEIAVNATDATATQLSADEGTRGTTYVYTVTPNDDTANAAVTITIQPEEVDPG